MAARRPFWKWPRWKSIGFCLWPPSTCIWNLEFKFQSKLNLCSGNHVVYRQTDRRTDGRTDKVNPVYSVQLRWAGYKNCNIPYDIMLTYFEKTDMLLLDRQRVRYHFSHDRVTITWSLWCHQQSIVTSSAEHKLKSETWGRCVKIVVFVIIYGFIMSWKKLNNVCTLMMNCFCAHLSVILVFISRIALQLGK